MTSAAWIIGGWVIGVGALIGFAVWRGIKRKREEKAKAEAQKKPRKSSFQRSLDRSIYRRAVDAGATPLEARKLVKLHNDKAAQRDTVNNG